MGASCNGCGSCCDPVSLPFTQDEARRSHLDERTRHWILNDLTPMSRRVAKQREPWHFDTPIHGKNINDSIPFFYSCRWFDEQNRVCTNYDNRPEPCRTYPWRNGVPNPRAALPPTCSYRDDIGQPVAFVTKPKFPIDNSGGREVE